MTAIQTLDRHARASADDQGEGVVVMARCAGTTAEDKACTTSVPVGTVYCYHHDPARAEERSRKASRAASAKHDSVAKEMRQLRDVVWELTIRAIEGNLPLRVVMRMNHIIQLLQTFLRSAEIELASGKEPERGSVLSPDMLEKLQQYIAYKDGEGAETPAVSSPAGEELPEAVVQEWRERLQAEINQGLGRQPS